MKKRILILLSLVLSSASLQAPMNADASEALQTDLDLYSTTMDSYYWVFAKGLNKTMDISAYNNQDICYLCRYDNSLADIGYYFYDLDKDGVDELFIGRTRNDGYNFGMLYAMYALDKGTPIEVLSSEERTNYYLCNNDTIYKHGSGGAQSFGDEYYILNSETNQLDLIERVGYDAFVYPDDPYSYSVELDGSSVTISEETAQQIYNKYEKADITYITFDNYQPGVDTGYNRETDYILPYSDSQYISEEMLAYMDAQQLCYAKNEIYARHGREFNSAELSDYFWSMPWYTGGIAPEYFDESVLNEYEVYNIDLLANYEFQLTDGAGYQLY